MPTLKSSTNASSKIYSHNREHMLDIMRHVRELEAKIRINSERSKEKFSQRNQLLPRERLVRLLDYGSSFIEFSTLAGFKMHDDDGDENIAGGNVITGIGVIEGLDCVVMVSDSGIKGGTLTPMGAKKIIRAQIIALENKLPIVNLLESAGGNLHYQGENFVPGGELFFNEARLSANGIPQITVVHGPSTAGGAYIPGLTDYIIMVRERARVYLAGPPLLKAATGETATDEELGGADMHATVSGTAEYLAADDSEAIAIARNIIKHISAARELKNTVVNNYDEPLYDIDEVLGIVPAEDHTPYDCREIIARLVDASEFLEFKQGFGAELVCGHAAIGGQPVGVIGNNGPIYPAGSQKAAHFIQACCQVNFPIIYLQNITGYMVGKAVEIGGAVKHGSKMIQAVSNATVPQITLMIGASYGAGNYGMCGRAFGPRFVFAWPNSKVAIMGGEQAARVMTTITRNSSARKGKKIDDEAIKRQEDAIRERISHESSALYITARIWDDGIIDPRDSRKLLLRLLQISTAAETKKLHANTFGVARF